MQTPNPIDELDPYNSTVQPGQRVRIIIETTLVHIDQFDEKQFVADPDTEAGRVDLGFASPGLMPSGKPNYYSVEIPPYSERPEDDVYSIEILD
jgi:hypothetical protein